MRKYVNLVKYLGFWWNTLILKVKTTENQDEIPVFYRNRDKKRKERNKIMNDNKITIAIGIFLIILCGLFTYKAMLKESDFEARMGMLLPCGIIVVVIALSTILWTRK